MAQRAVPNIPHMEIRLSQDALRNQHIASMLRMGPVVLFNRDIAFRHTNEVIDGNRFRMRTPFLPDVFKNGWNQWFCTHGEAINDGIEFYHII